MTRHGVSDAQIAVITVTYESEGVIGDWLHSVRAVLPEAQIIVVDNDSSDRTAQIARSHPAGALVVETGENAGFARGCNAGAEAASRPVLWFLNPDTRVVNADRSALAAELAEKPFGILATAMEDEAGQRHHEIYRHRGPFGEWLAHVMTPLWPRRAGVNPWSVARGDDWVSGASLLVDADEFEALGGFDPSFFLLYEDRYLSWAATRAGLPMRRSEALAVSHAVGTSSSAENLDTRRRGWAILSWIEFSAASGSSASTRMRARSLLGSLAFLGWLGRTLSAAGLSHTRIARRSIAAGAVREFILQSIAGLRERGFYMRAADVLWSRGPRRS